MTDLMDASCVMHEMRASCKKQVLHDLADQAAKTFDLEGRHIAEAVMQREKLGSTGIGSGVAIPHARIEGLDEVKAIFATLAKPVDYDAVDERPVDLVLMLLAPDHAGADHLKALAMVSRILRRAEVRESLRAAPDAEALYTLLTERSKSSVAA